MEGYLVTAQFRLLSPNRRGSDPRPQVPQSRTLNVEVYSEEIGAIYLQGAKQGEREALHRLAPKFPDGF